MNAPRQSKPPNVKIVDSGRPGGRTAIEGFLRRSPFDPAVDRKAQKILNEIADKGDRAVAAASRRYDGVELQPGKFALSSREISAASRKVDAEFKRAVAEIRKRVNKFADSALKRNWQIRTPGGGRIGEYFTPIERVGVYVPGGTAPLVSTVLMTVTIAKTAGVKEIVVCTPPGRPDGSVNPYLLYTIASGGADEVYRIGGVQAIGMMAYGTRTVKRVLKIVGPGNAYVTAAKRLVYGTVALDLVAGPSEIAVLADSTADPRHIAADLLSQAEHGTGTERALLASTSREVTRRTRKELSSQASLLQRIKPVSKVMKQGMLLVNVKSLAEGIDLCSRFAPEHLELMVRNPSRCMKDIKSAGAVFTGPWSPEVTGDFVAGPSHVLPTGGAAAAFSGLSINDFFKKSSYISYSKADLRSALPVIRTLGKVEGLDAHVRSADIRFET
ncbi:MAG: histidinol dehydrogenase [Kiritimatiellia bacterium]